MRGGKADPGPAVSEMGGVLTGESFWREKEERERTALQFFLIVLQLMFSSSLHNDCVLRNSFDDVFEGSVAMPFRSLF